MNVNSSTGPSQGDVRRAVHDGSLQAGHVDFHVLFEILALDGRIGVSLTTAGGQDASVTRGCSTHGNAGHRLVSVSDVAREGIGGVNAKRVGENLKAAMSDGGVASDQRGETGDR